MTPKKKGERNGNVAGANVSVWTKVFTPKSQWNDKDEFLDVIYWLRQIVGLSLGVLWGLIPLKGLFAIVLFMALNAGLVNLYYTTFQCVDDEDYGGTWELVKEGYMASFAGFLVMWIIVYSGCHFD